MKVEIEILVENTTMIPALKAEYGFSALVTVDGQSYLYDTGLDTALLYNAPILHADLAACKGIILSHGHFDHTGAVMPVVKQYGIKKIYAHSNIFADRYGVGKDQGLRPNGCGFTQKELAEQGVQMVFTDDFTSLGEGIYVTGQIPRTTAYEDVGGDFRVKRAAGWEKDILEDDMGMVIDHPQGLIIISGCAHAGLVNMMRYAMQKTGRKKVLAFIGGTHLMTASPSRMEETILALREMQIERLIVSHCTGFYAAARLRQELGEKVEKAETGMRFCFEA